jgi:hypothetical protein
MSHARKIAKAIFAVLATFLGTLITALSGDQTFSELSTRTWLTIALATLIAGFGVYGISNGSPIVPEVMPVAPAPEVMSASVTVTPTPIPPPTPPPPPPPRKPPIKPKGA